MLPSECGTDGSSNTRITCAIVSTSRKGASASRFFSFCMPPKSTYCTVAYVIFFGLYSLASSTSRGSGTFATPTCVADAPPFPSTCAFVNIRNSVVFPTCGSPIIPVCTPAPSIRYLPPAQTRHPSTPGRGRLLCGPHAFVPIPHPYPGSSTLFSHFGNLLLTQASLRVTVSFPALPLGYLPGAVSVDIVTGPIFQVLRGGSSHACHSALKQNPPALLRTPF